ncbi:hypothetical protein EDC31_12926 [Acidomonas methanolica]|nr:hypothetical protein EDC31_12926 [Acidomonas methanolica]
MPEVVALDANLLLMSFLRLRQKRSDPLRSNPSRSGRYRDATCRAEAEETENYTYAIPLLNDEWDVVPALFHSGSPARPLPRDSPIGLLRALPSRQSGKWNRPARYPRPSAPKGLVQAGCPLHPDRTCCLLPQSRRRPEGHPPALRSSRQMGGDHRLQHRRRRKLRERQRVEPVSGSAVNGRARALLFLAVPL